MNFFEFQCWSSVRFSSFKSIFGWQNKIFLSFGWNNRVFIEKFKIVQFSNFLTCFEILMIFKVRRPFSNFVWVLRFKNFNLGLKKLDFGSKSKFEFEKNLNLIFRPKLEKVWLEKTLKFLSFIFSNRVLHCLIVKASQASCYCGPLLVGLIPKVRVPTESPS